MSEIIHEIAQIQLPQELLQQVDIAALLEKFKATHKKLGDFKSIRDNHANRSVLKKFGDLVTFDDTLENAHLDAVEVQADFSKAIGQLMVLSIMQAQHLDRQQQQLSAQQITIKTQTNSIEKHNAILADQHEELANQNIALEKWIKEFLALKGLTEKDAKKLIEIAHEVKNTRDQLLQSVENSLSDSLRQIGAIEAQIKLELVKCMEWVDSQIVDTKIEINKELSAQLLEVNGQLAAAELIRLELISSNQKLSSDIQEVEAKTDGQYKELNQSTDQIRLELADSNQKLISDIQAAEAKSDSQFKKLNQSDEQIRLELTKSTQKLNSDIHAVESKTDGQHKELNESAEQIKANFLAAMSDQQQLHQRKVKQLVISIVVLALSQCGVIGYLASQMR